MTLMITLSTTTAIITITIITITIIITIITASIYSLTYNLNAFRKKTSATSALFGS